MASWTNRSASWGAPAIRTAEVYVVFTSVEETLQAVGIACDLAKGLSAELTLVQFRSVSYQFQLGEPTGGSPVEMEAFVNQLKAEEPKIRVRVYLCRNPTTAMPAAFRPHSLIVVGGRRRWWPTQSERWRRRLEAAGHFVVFVDTSKQSGQPEAESLRSRPTHSEARW